MAERPDELRQEINETRQHLGEVADALGGKLEDAVATAKRRVTPRYVVTDHPATSLAAAFLGGFGLSVVLLPRPASRREYPMLSPLVAALAVRYLG